MIIIINHHWQSSSSIIIIDNHHHQSSSSSSSRIVYSTGIYLTTRILRFVFSIQIWKSKNKIKLNRQLTPPPHHHHQHHQYHQYHVSYHRLLLLLLLLLLSPIFIMRIIISAKLVNIMKRGAGSNPTLDSGRMCGQQPSQEVHCSTKAHSRQRQNVGVFSCRVREYLAEFRGSTCQQVFRRVELMSLYINDEIR